MIAVLVALALMWVAGFLVGWWAHQPERCDRLHWEPVTDRRWRHLWVVDPDEQARPPWDRLP